MSKSYISYRHAAALLLVSTAMSCVDTRDIRGDKKIPHSDSGVCEMPASTSTSDIFDKSRDIWSKYANSMSISGHEDSKFLFVKKGDERGTIKKVDEVFMSMRAKGIPMGLLLKV